MLWDVSVEPFFNETRIPWFGLWDMGILGTSLFPMSAQAEESHFPPSKVRI